MPPNRWLSLRRYVSLFISLIILIGITPTVSVAQDISYGLKAGANISTFHDSRFQTHSRAGINVGIFSRIPVEKSAFALQPELHYTQKGANTSFQFGDIIRKGPLATDYLELPLLGVYSVDLSPNLKGQILLGPSVSYLISARFNSSVDIDHTTHAMDAGIAGGLGLSLPFQSHRLSLEVRFNRGFLEVLKSGYNPECCGSFERTAKNNAFAILLGIQL